MPIDLLKPYAGNARTHSDRQLAKIAASLEAFGWMNPLLAEQDGTIIAGHGRWQAAKMLGQTEVPVIRFEHLSPDELRAYRLADNRLAELSGWDDDILAIELQHLSDIDIDFNIETLGWDHAEIDILLDPPVSDPENAEDPADADIPAPPQHPVAKSGDLWLLGEHRLYCGSSLDALSFPLSLRNVEDLLFERGIDVSHETIRFWWNRFGPLFASDIRRQRVSRMRGLQPTIPHLTRSSLHRCLQRHGISRLPALEGDAAEKKRFKVYPIGYFHIDVAEVRTKEGKLHLYVGIDRTSKFAFAQLHEKADRPTAVLFLEALLEAVPYDLHTILTDNGIQFADLPRNRDGWTARYRVHRFDQICRERGIDHRITKPNHPWTNGQIERMNRTIKEATVKRYHYDTHAELPQHLQIFIDADNHGRRLKTLRGLTPYEYIARIWTDDLGRFSTNPYCHISGLNT